MKNPYTPGFDDIPPVLAGRDQELNILDRVTKDLSDRSPTGSNIILYGPRGNGKTALLNFAHKRMKEESEIRSIIVVPPEVNTPTDLYSALLKEAVHSEETITNREGVKAGLSGTGIDASRTKAKVFESTTSVLRKKCADMMIMKPTLLMVDEAHRISSESLDAVLSLAKAAKREETNFRFVFAGTPGLPAQLEKMDATYLDRAQSIRLERLSYQSTKVALFRPLEEAGYTINMTDSEKEDLLEQTQRYPHFIQCVGYAIWDVAEELDIRYVDASVVASAKPEWEKQVNRMYASRYRQLDRLGLASHAIAIASAFFKSEHLTAEDIRGIISENDSDVRPQELLDEMESLGYIWEAEGTGDLYEPGIPSLMGHVLRIARDREERNQSRSRDDDFELGR